MYTAILASLIGLAAAKSINFSAWGAPDSTCEGDTVINQRIFEGECNTAKTNQVSGFSSFELFPDNDEASECGVSIYSDETCGNQIQGDGFNGVASPCYAVDGSGVAFSYRLNC